MKFACGMFPTATVDRYKFVDGILTITDKKEAEEFAEKIKNNDTITIVSDEVAVVVSSSANANKTKLNDSIIKGNATNSSHKEAKVQAEVAALGAKFSK